MQAVIADLALESEAATALALRLAGAVDRDERALLRLALPAAKYLVCKRAPRSSPRRWSAWAATDTSRTRGCRGSTARRR